MSRADEKDEKHSLGPPPQEAPPMAIHDKSEWSDVLFVVKKVQKELYSDVFLSKAQTQPLDGLIAALESWRRANYRDALMAPRACMCLAELAWYSMAILSHADTLGSQSLKQAVATVTQHASRSVDGEWTWSQLAAALHKRMRMRLIVFHHVHQIPIDFTLLLKKDAPKIMELIKRIGVDQERLQEQKDRKQLENSPALYEHEVKMEKLTAVERFVFEIPAQDLPVYCQAVAIRTSPRQRDSISKLVSVCSRQAWCETMLQHLLADVDCTDLAHAAEYDLYTGTIEAMIARFHVWARRPAEFDRAGKFNQGLRDFLWEILLPGGSWEHYRETFGQDRVSDQTYIRVKYSFDSLGAESELSNGLMVTLRQLLSHKAVDILAGKHGAAVQDVYSFFFFMYMYGHTVEGADFRKEHVILPDQLGQKAGDISRSAPHISYQPIRFRRPTIVIFGGKIVLHVPVNETKIRIEENGDKTSEPYRIVCPTLMHAAMAWVWVVSSVYQGLVCYETAPDVSILEFASPFLDVVDDQHSSRRRPRDAGADSSDSEDSGSDGEAAREPANKRARVSGRAPIRIRRRMGEQL